MSAAGNAYGGMIPAEFVEEVDRILPILATPGVMLLTGAGFDRALVVQTEAPALITLARSSREVAAMMLAAALIEPFGVPGEVLRWVISPAGRKVQTAALARAARKREIDVERAQFPRLEEIRKILAGPIGAAERTRLLEFFEAVGGGVDHGSAALEWAALGCQFSSDELSVIMRLSRAPGQLVESRALYRSFAAGRLGGGDLPDQGLVRMVLRRIRDKLASAGVPIQIETRRGQGVALVVTAPGFSLPGQS